MSRVSHTESISANALFKRKSYSKPFTNHKGLDDFIQTSLDKYHFVDPAQEMYEATDGHSNFIVSNKSAIPDLVIYNKKFNKNECFCDADTTVYNSFPRLKFILKAKPPVNQKPSSSSNITGSSTGNNPGSIQPSGSSNILITNASGGLKPINNSLPPKGNNFNNFKDDMLEEDDPQWGDVDVKELEKTKVQFQALPGADIKAAEMAESRAALQKKKLEEKLDENDEEDDEKILQKMLEKNANVGEEAPRMGAFNGERNMMRHASREDHNSNFNSRTMRPNNNNFGNHNFGNNFREVPNNNFMDNMVNQGNRRNFNNNNFNNNNYGNNPKLTFDQDTLFSEEFQFQSLPNRGQPGSLGQNQGQGGHGFHGQPQHNMMRRNSREMEQQSLNYKHQPQSNQMREENAFTHSSDYRNQFNEQSRGDNLNSKKHQMHEMQMLQNQIISQSGNIMKNLSMNMNKEEDFGTKGMQVPVQNLRSRMPEPSQIGNMPSLQNPLMTINNYYDENSSKNNAPQFLEDPLYIVTKNLFNQGWFLMTENNKILANFNSVELLGFLEEEIRAANNLSNVWLTDYETDMFFNPMVLYEVLRENIPRLMETVRRQKGLERNQPKHPMGLNTEVGHPQRHPPYANKFDNQPRNRSGDMEPVFNNRPPYRGKSDINPGVNMNINLQFVQNDINLNNYNLNRGSPGQYGNLDIGSNQQMKGPNRMPSSNNGEVNYSNLFNTSLSSDFKNNKNQDR